MQKIIFFVFVLFLCYINLHVHAQRFLPYRSFHNHEKKESGARDYSYIDTINFFRINEYIEKPTYGLRERFDSYYFPYSYGPFVYYLNDTVVVFSGNMVISFLNNNVIDSLNLEDIKGLPELNEKPLGGVAFTFIDNASLESEKIQFYYSELVSFKFRYRITLHNKKIVEIDTVNLDFKFKEIYKDSIFSYQMSLSTFLKYNLENHEIDTIYTIIDPSYSHGLRRYVKPYKTGLFFLEEKSHYSGGSDRCFYPIYYDIENDYLSRDRTEIYLMLEDNYLFDYFVYNSELYYLDQDGFNNYSISTLTIDEEEIYNNFFYDNFFHSRSHHLYRLPKYDYKKFYMINEKQFFMIGEDNFVYFFYEDELVQKKNLMNIIDLKIDRINQKIYMITRDDFEHQSLSFTNYYLVTLCYGLHK